MGTSKVFLIFLIVSVTSNANLVFSTRKLIDSAPIQSNNSSSVSILASNSPVNGEKEVDSTINDKKSEIGKEKPENPQGSGDPPKPGPEELNSTKVSDGSSPAEKQKPEDPKVSDNAPKDLVDHNATTMNDGSSKAESEQPKDPQGSNNSSKADPKETKSSAVNGESPNDEKEKPKEPQPQGSNDSAKLDPHIPKNDNVTVESPPPVENKNEEKKNVDNTVKENEEKKNADDTVKENKEKKNVDDTVKENEEKNNVDDTVKKNEEKKNVDDTVNSEVNTNVSCLGAAKMCNVEQTLVACIQAPPNGSAELFLVVQNEGEKGVKVNLNIQPPLDSPLQAVKIAKHQSKKIDISSILGKGAEIVLNTGDGSCRLHLDRRVSVDNILQQVSLYSKRVTPIYGAYFSFLVALLFGGTWACCKLRKKRHQDGVPYQELEMGIPESTSASNVVTADGWDQDWDDDWDEENAVKSPGGRTFGNISANGLTARSSKRDGWENDWDD